jgi:HK97 family phage major capsid protein
VTTHKRLRSTTALPRDFRVYAEASGIDAVMARFAEYDRATTRALAEQKEKLAAAEITIEALTKDINRIGVQMAGDFVNGVGDPAWVRTPAGAVGRPALNIGALRQELGAIGDFARLGTDVRASLSIGSDPDGGYTVLPQYSQSMTTKLFDAVTMRRLARVETLTTGDAWVEPLDIGEPTAVWVGEAEARPATATPKMGLLTVPLQEQYALQPITQSLLDMSSIDIGAWLDGKIVDKFGRAENVSFLSGDGFKKAVGILSVPIVSTSDATRSWGSIQYIPGGDSSTVTADGLKNLVWGLRAPYRGGAQFLMNSNTANAIDKLRATTTGEYMWRQSMASGVPDTLLGYPVQFDEAVPDIGVNSTPIIFANFKLSYLIVDKSGVRMLRDPYTSKPNVLFYAYRRVGGGVANSEAVKVLKIATS